MRMDKQLSIGILMFLLSSNMLFAADDSTAIQNDSQIHWGVSPVIFSGPETGVALGGYVMGYGNSDPSLPQVKQDTLNAMIVYTQKEQMLCTFNVKKYLRGDQAILMGSLGYVDFPGEFFGVGSNTDPDTKEDYTYIQKGFTGSFLWKLSPDIYFGPCIVYGRYDIEDQKAGGMLETGNILGSDGTTIAGGGLQLLLDTRDDEFAPRYGSVLNLQGISYRREWGSDQDFEQYGITYKHFWPVRERGTFALMSLFNISEGDVPFEMMPCLGGDSIMRGYYSGVYRDKDYVALQGEYRYPMGSRVSGVLFAGLGEVASEVDQFRADQMKVAAGFGFRFQLYPKQKLKLRLDQGFSEDGTYTYLNFMEAF